MPSLADLKALRNWQPILPAASTGSYYICRCRLSQGFCLFYAPTRPECVFSSEPYIWNRCQSAPPHIGLISGHDPRIGQYLRRFSCSRASRASTPCQFSPRCCSRIALTGTARRRPSDSHHHTQTCMRHAGATPHQTITLHRSEAKVHCSIVKKTYGTHDPRRGHSIRSGSYWHRECRHRPPY